MEICFSLGSNLGDRLAHLSAAKRRILARPDARLVAQSPVYETEPVDVKPMYRDLKFLNAVLIVESPWPPEKWLSVSNEIENAMGRERSEDRNAPRPMDIDIIYADDLSVDTEALRLPHPRWAERGFVVKPLADVRPDLVLPGEDETVREVLASLEELVGVGLFVEEW